MTVDEACSSGNQSFGHGVNEPFSVIFVLSYAAMELDIALQVMAEVNVTEQKIIFSAIGSLRKASARPFVSCSQPPPVL